MQQISYQNVTVTGGFWKQKQDLLRKKTVYAVYDRFKETGRFDAFRCDWKEGDPIKPHYFWDSDVAKWLEGVAYLTAKHREPGLEKIADAVVDLIEKNQGADGYFNIYFTVVEPEARFQRRRYHELYCAGHLMEAAVAYYEATGKRKLLDLMCKYADYIEERFVKRRDTGFATPGHEEIELALVRLAECTGEKRYLALAEHFVDLRGVPGNGDGEMEPWSALNNQSHLPVREQREAEGHSVRAAYLYCAMADLALRTGDAALREACEAIFNDIVNRKMYVTGGIGSSACGEAFTVPYDLPNLLAYTESCAAIGLALFASRMTLIEPDSRYADTVERILYNGFLSSTSLDGTSFFYENPTEIMPYLQTKDRSDPNSKRKIRMPLMTRQAVFGCSCCPPNIVRFLASLGNLLYTNDGETLYIHQFMQSEATVSLGGRTLHVGQKTRYPESGKVKITVTGGNARIAVRVPWWCEKPFETVKGYVFLDARDGEPLELDFGMPVRLIEARPEVLFDCNRYAVMRGPVVYCMEGQDNGGGLREIRLDGRAAFHVGRNREIGVPTLTVKAWRRKREESEPLYSPRRTSGLEATTATLIPYYAFANRGEDEMQVWHFVR